MEIIIRRIVSALIDLIVCILVNSCVILAELLIYSVIERPFVFLSSENFVFTYNLFMATSIIVVICYYIVLDKFGISLGKKITKLKLIYHGSEFDGIPWKIAFGHSVAKIVSSFVYPFSIIYLIIQKNMLYDRWLRIKVYKKEKAV